MNDNKLNKLILSEINRTREIMGLITEQGGTPGWSFSVFNTHCDLSLGYISVQVNPGSTCNATSFNWTIEDASGTIQVMNPMFQGVCSFGSNGINTCPITPGSSLGISSGPSLVDGSYTFTVISNTGSCPNPQTPLPISQSFTISNCSGGGVNDWECISPGNCQQTAAGTHSTEAACLADPSCQPTNPCPSSHGYHSWPYGYRTTGCPWCTPQTPEWPAVNLALANQSSYCEWCADWISSGSVPGTFNTNTGIWVGGPYDESCCGECPASGTLEDTPPRPSLRKRGPQDVIDSSDEPLEDRDHTSDDREPSPSDI